MLDSIIKFKAYAWLLGIGFFLNGSINMCNSSLANSGCNDSPCREYLSLIQQNLTASLTYNQAFLDVIEVNTDTFTIGGLGFNVVATSPTALLIAPNGQHYTIQKTNPNDLDGNSYDFGVDVSTLSGSWSIVLSVVTKDADGLDCNIRIRTDFEVLPQAISRFTATTNRRFLFEEPALTALTDVKLIANGNEYDLGDYTNTPADAEQLRLDFENALIVEGYTVDFFGDFATNPGGFGYNATRGWILAVFANDGVEDQIELVHSGGSFVKNFDSDFENTDSGVFLRYFPGGGETFTDVSDIELTVGNTLAFESTTNNYVLIDLQSEKYFDAASTTWGAGSQIVLNGNVYPITPPNPANLAQVAAEIEAALKQEDQNIQSASQVVAEYYELNCIYNATENRVELIYPQSWTVAVSDNVASLTLTNVGSGNLQTGYQGYLTTSPPPPGLPPNVFVNVIFNVLGVVGNEPSLTLEYEVSGQPRVQVFTYDPGTKTYS